MTTSRYENRIFSLEPSATHCVHGGVLVRVDTVPGMLFHLFVLSITTVVHSVNKNYCGISLCKVNSS